MPEYYEIKMRDHLDPCWSDWFAGLKRTYLEDNETLLSGPLMGGFLAIAMRQLDMDPADGIHDT